MPLKQTAPTTEIALQTLSCLAQPTRKMTITYQLHTPHDADDSTPTTYDSPIPVQQGDVVFVANGMWHRVDWVRMLPSGRLQLTVAQSACSPADALLQLPTEPPP